MTEIRGADARRIRDGGHIGMWIQERPRDAGASRRPWSQLVTSTDRQGHDRGATARLRPENARRIIATRRTSTVRSAPCRTARKYDSGRKAAPPRTAAAHAKTTARRRSRLRVCLACHPRHVPAGTPSVAPADETMATPVAKAVERSGIDATTFQAKQDRYPPSPKDGRHDGRDSEARPSAPDADNQRRADEVRRCRAVSHLRPATRRGERAREG